jgi:seryl-tRNA synthetase
MSTGNGVFKIETTKGTKELEANVAQIIYPPEFEELADGNKIIYLKKGWSSSNHALDVMQKERNQASEVVARQEVQIKNLQMTINKNNSLYSSEMNKANAREQELNADIVSKQKDINRLQDTLDNIKKENV